MKKEISKWVFSELLSTYLYAVFLWNREHFFTAWRVGRKLWGLRKQPIYTEYY